MASVLDCDQWRMMSLQDDPTLERDFQGHRGSVSGVDFSPNHEQLASVSVDGSLLIWPLTAKARALRFVGHGDAVTGVQFSPAGNLVATSSKDRSVRLWTPAMRGKSCAFRAHTAAVCSVAFSHDGRRLVTASNDKSVKVWSVHGQCFDFSLTQHTNWVRCARFSPDDRLIASCGDDRSVRVWDSSNRHCINCFSDYGGSTTRVEFNSSGTCIAYAVEDGSLKIWDLRTNKPIQHYQVQGTGITSFSFHPSNNYMICSSSDGALEILDLLEGRLIYTLRGHKGAARAVSFSRDGELFASGADDSQVLLWRTNFDSSSYQDVLQQHTRRCRPDPPPHISDIHPRGPHLHQAQQACIQIAPMVADTQSAAPHITELSQAVHSATHPNGQRHQSPAQSDGSEQRCCNGLKEWTGEDDVIGSSSAKQTEEKTGTRPPGALAARPSRLDSTLGHIAQQLHLLTQTVSVLEERLTLTEDKLSECLVHQAQIIRAARPAGERRGTDDMLDDTMGR